MAEDNDAERSRRVRRTALILALVALAFYIGFIVMSVVRSRHAGHRPAEQPAIIAPR